MYKTPFPPRKWTWPHYYLVRYGPPAIWRCCGGWRVDGRENVPRTGGAVIAPNHVSFLDPPVVGAALPRRTYYFAKKELFDVPLFGWIMWTCHAFPVERGASDRGAIQNAINLLKAGELLVMFPEGARSQDGELGEASLGAALVASRANAPIIPCALYGTDKALPIHAKWPHRHRIHVRFGPPVYVEEPEQGRARKQALAATMCTVMESIAQMQARLREMYEGSPGPQSPD